MNFLLYTYKIIKINEAGELLFWFNSFEYSSLQTNYKNKKYESS